MARGAGCGVRGASGRRSILRAIARGWQQRDRGLLDTVSFDRGHFHLQALVSDLIAYTRRPPPKRQDQAADAVHVLVPQIQIEQLPELVDAQRAANTQSAHRVAAWF